MSQQNTRSIDTRLLINVLLLGLLFLVLLNFYFVYQMRGALKHEQPEAQASPQVELSLITAPDCEDCFDIESIARVVRRAKINITSERQVGWNSPEAQALISKGNITHAPALTISGQIDNLYMEPLKQRGDMLVFDFANPPYIDVLTGEVKGRTAMTVIDARGCTQCFNISTVIDQIQNVVRVHAFTRINYQEPQAKAIIKQYNISKIPAVILSKDAELYVVVNRSWNALGTYESDGSMVLRSTPPPYLDPSTGTLVGLVGITYLTDQSCKECYNVSIHRAVLAQLGIAFGKETWVDISSPEGKEMVKKYSVKSVPTILLPKNVDMYPLLNQIWEQVGTIENDGTHVFRTLEALGNIRWKDVSTGKISGVPTLFINSTSNSTTMVEGSGK